MAYWYFPILSAEQIDTVKTYMSQEAEVCEIVELLLQKRADVNAGGADCTEIDASECGWTRLLNKTPLCAAVQRGSPSLVRKLLEARADVNITVTQNGMCKNSHAKPENFVDNIYPEGWAKRAYGDS